MPIYGLNYGTTPGYGSSLGYPSAPAGIPTGSPGGPPALGTWSTPPGGGGGATTIPPFDPSSQIPGIDQIAQAINQLNLTAQQAANAARIPNATGLETQSSNVISDLLGGKIPKDVVAQEAQLMAERGVGFDPGSPNTNAALARLFGLTSIDLQQKGEADLTAAENRNPGAPIVDPSKFVMTPYQQALLALEQERLRLGYQPRLGTYTGPGSGGGGAPYSYTPDPFVPRVAPPAVGNFGNLLPPDMSGGGGGLSPDTFSYSGMPDYNVPGTDPSLMWSDYLGTPIDTSGGYYDFYNPPSQDLVNVMPGYGGDLSNFDFTGYGG